MEREQDLFRVRSFERTYEHCQRVGILLGKVTKQMQRDLDFEGTIDDYLDYLKARINSGVLLTKWQRERLAWWREHLGFLIRTTAEKRRKRQERLDKTSRANQANYQWKLESIVFEENPYE
jgi:hypothetical protein